jgi:hypothetical protein
MDIKYKVLKNNFKKIAQTKNHENRCFLKHFLKFIV